MEAYTRGFATGSFIGLGTGALLGLLFAPQKGWKTRRQLLRKGEHLVDRAGDSVHSATHLVERSRRRLGV